MAEAPKAPGRGREPVLRPARLWTVEEADGRLPQLRELLHELRGSVTRLRKLHEELGRLAAFWGKELDAPDHPDKALKDRLQAEWESLHGRVDSRLQGLHSEGIELKDLDAGLVDFYGLLDGKLVLFCWQQGEGSVGFFHAVGGGYRTRQPLPGRPRAR
jgi:hypothetical protein